MPYRRFVFSAISSSHASSASNSSERGLRNSAESKGLRMKTMSSEGTRESWTYGDADADGPRAGLSDVEYCTMQHRLTLCFIIGTCVRECQSELFQEARLP